VFRPIGFAPSTIRRVSMNRRNTSPLEDMQNRVGWIYKPGIGPGDSDNGVSVEDTLCAECVIKVSFTSYPKLLECWSALPVVLVCPVTSTFSAASIPPHHGLLSRSCPVDPRG
jgi:hypothetical protein